MQRKFRIYLGIALVTFLLAILYYDKFYHNRSLGNITRHEKSISSNFYHEEFTLQADLELINVRDKSRTTLKQVCEDQVNLVFRYFATNCEECIFNTIAALYDYYKDDNIIATIIMSLISLLNQDMGDSDCFAAAY